MLLKVLYLPVVMAQCSVVLEAASAVMQGWTVGDTLGNLALGSLNLQIQIFGTISVCTYIQLNIFVRCHQVRLATS